MAATQAATNTLGLYAHWSLILNGYLGRECTHIKVSKTLDPNGYVIDTTETETTIYGAVSTVKAEAVHESAGLLQYGDLTAYFMAEEDVLVGNQVSENVVRYDMIEYESKRYTVEQLRNNAYDGGEAIVCKYNLRLVANES